VTPKFIKLFLCFLWLPAYFLATPALAQSPSNGTPAYLNPSLPLDQRVEDLVSRMTLEEKASQVVHVAAAIPRLHVPAYNWWTESLHGVAMAGTATVFPEPIGLGATFDTPLIHHMAEVISTEARAKHEEEIRHGNFTHVALDFWAPTINIVRDPRWGRGQETYGEDPFLTSTLAVAYVTGMQGDDPKYLRTIATPKHYAVHSGPESLRHTIDVQVSKQDEEDTYLPAFRAAIVDAKAGSILCAYSSINGEPACVNRFLLQDQLRDKWKFQGYVTSDCDSVAELYSGHHTKTPAEAAALALERGMDLDCNYPGNDSSHYLEAVKQGLVAESVLDTSVKRLFRARFLLGMFDPPAMVKYAQIPPSENDSEAHRQLALEVARKTMVLLKNDGTLPLRPGLRKIAVIGPLADQTEVLLGNYHGKPSRAVSALDGIRNAFPKAQVTYTPGTDFLRNTVMPVPASWLKTPDGKPGIKAEYFLGMSLAGSPIVTRIDKDVNFEFGGNSPAPGVPGTNFSARWTGSLTVPNPGSYKLGVTGDDGYRLWLDGKLLVEDLTIKVGLPWPGPSTKQETVSLEKGRKYAIKLEFFQSQAGAAAKLVWSPPPQVDALAEAVANARSADAIVAVVGITSLLEGEEMQIDLPGFHGGDRTSLDLPQQEQALLEAAQATGKPLVVVLMNGSALSVNWAQQHANAILDAWYSGEEGGNAIGQTLSGINNPGGRLPVTFYTGVDQLPDFTNYAMKNRTYRFFTGKPLYPFGYGLSYSRFSYSRLRLSKKNLAAGDSLAVDVEVSNASHRAGDEVVQVYLSFPPYPGAPRHALRGFARVHLMAGESRPVHLTLAPRDLSAVDENGDRLVMPGDYRLAVGGGQPDSGAPGLQTEFSIQGRLKLLE
jgi:beta-glucosidase